MTVASGQPSSLVGAFEKPIRSSDGYVARAVEALAKHASEVFGTWRQPSSVWVTGTPSELGALADLGDLRSFDELVEAAGSSVLESV